MNSREFLKYIKNCEIDWNESEKSKLLFFINAVYEIEHWKETLEEKTEFQYLREFMLPNDYRKIILDLKSFRIKIFYKRLKEEQKRLKEVNTSVRDSQIIIKNFAVKQAKKLKLRISTDKEGKFLVE